MTTVLIVDDAYFMRLMLRDILTKAGFEILGEAENGEEALKKYFELQPDLVTMDVVMPVMDGITAVRNILSRDAEAKIIMCSALGQQTLVFEAINAGAKDYIVKPFSPGRVVEIMGRLAIREVAH
jgi:two-component system chemotaxis response regulator CheY